jgi:dihydrofolate reductase
MLASAGNGDLWIVGGGYVASQFADAGLLDEVAVTIVPVVLGEGKPLFYRRLSGGVMQLRGVFPRANGMVELRYAISKLTGGALGRSQDAVGGGAVVEARVTVPEVSA